MQRISIYILTALLVTAITPEAFAQRSRTFFQASRALAMGDAYTAHDVGYEAVYYNPAGVARKNKPQLKLFDFEGSASSDSLGLLSDTLSATAQLSRVTEYISENPGKTYSLGLALLPQFLVKNFSIGFLGRFQSEAYSSVDTGQMDLYAYSDVAMYAHYGVSLFGGIIKIGAGVKLLDRAEINKAYEATEYQGNNSLQFDNQWQEGVGFGYDAGMLLILPIRFLPTFGVSIQEIGDTNLEARKVLFSGNGNEPPAPLEQRINAGIALTIKHERGTSTTFSFDVKDIENLSDYAEEHFHGGMELNMRDTFFLRAGVNQGKYWTGGLGLHVGGNGIEVSSYGENIRSPVAGLSREERKWVGRYVIQF